MIAQSKNRNNDVPSLDSTPTETPNSSRPSTPAGHLLTAKSGPGGKTSRRARKAANIPSAHASGEEPEAKKWKGGKSTVKKGRRWDADGMATSDDEDVPLDYSSSAVNGSSTNGGHTDAVETVEQTSWGSKTGKGQFVLKDLDDQVNSILSAADSKRVEARGTPTGLVGSGLSAISGLFRNVVGGKTLTKEDLDKAMKGMEDHLLKKNVAREAAIRLCESVERELIGVKTGSFESMHTAYYLTEHS